MHVGCLGSIKSYILRYLVGIDTSFSETIQWKKRTPYYPKNESDYEAVDAAWNAIIPDHGIVALDREWAEERGLPRSMYLPSNMTKVLYYLEAYHQLHCGEFNLSKF